MRIDIDESSDEGPRAHVESLDYGFSKGQALEIESAINDYYDSLGVIYPTNNKNGSYYEIK